MKATYDLPVDDFDDRINVQVLRSLVIPLRTHFGVGWSYLGPILVQKDLFGSKIRRTFGPSLKFGSS